MTTDSASAFSFGPDPTFPLGEFLPEPPPDRFVREPAREVPVLAECDVAVFGGGTTGVCAAAAAAREGKRVVLVERYGFLGGMATAANVIVWHSLYGTDHGTKVIGGLPEEIIERLRRLGAVRSHEPEGGYDICPETTKFVLDDMAIGGGAKLLLHTRLVGAVRDGSRITAAIVEGKSGRAAILANTYIDCTGDADLLRFAGCPTRLGDPDGKCQAPTLCWRMAGRKPGAADNPDIVKALRAEPMDYNRQPYSCFLWGRQSVWTESELMLAGTRVLNVNAADTLDLTRAEVEARYQLRWILRRLRNLPGWEEAYLTDIGTQLGVRQTHRAITLHEVTREELLEGRTFTDVIAQGTYPVDIHSPDGAGINFWHLDGTTRRISADGKVEAGRWDGQPADAPPRETLCYQVPYRSLVPADVDNVLVAGRCIGADHHAAGALRVMINCMQFGQAAGSAAAIMPPGGSARDIDTSRLQRRLIAAGAPLRIAGGGQAT